LVDKNECNGQATRISQAKKGPPILGDAQNRVQIGTEGWGLAWE